MGVKDLWKLLAPCGHRVTIETLAGRRLSVDVSIWLVQFLKAMRLPTGEPMPNAHIVGLLRRLLRLLYHGVAPIFVFDGPAPRLKRQTIAARKKQRDAYGESHKRLAEKILLAQLKMRSVQQLKKKLSEHAGVKEEEERKSGEKPARKKRRKNTKADENEAAASSSANTAPSTSAATAAGTDASTAIDVDAEDNDVPRLQPAADDSIEWEVDESNAAASSSSHANPQSSTSTSTSRSRPVPQFDDQKSNDKDEGSPDFEMPPDLPEGPSDDEAEQRVPHEDDHFVLPADGKVDANVLAKLPISLQYQVMQQQREHNRFHNFHKFTAVEHDPDKFSNLQMNGFLTSVKFSQSIDTLRKEMNLMVGPPGSSSASTSTAKDGSKLLVDSSRPTSSTSGSAFIYYKSSASTNGTPFSWRESIKKKEKEQEAKVRRRKKKYGDDAREVVEEIDEDEDEAEEDETESKLQFITSSHQDEEWLCSNCCGVNKNLAKLDTEAAKNTCQTCGLKREMNEDENEMQIQMNNPASRTFKPSLTATLASSIAVKKETKKSKLRGVPSDDWQSPAERYGGAKQSPQPPQSDLTQQHISFSLTSDPCLVPQHHPPPPTSRLIAAAHVPVAQPPATQSVQHDDMPSLERGSVVSDDPRTLICRKCTFLNPSSALQCQMCESALIDRPALTEKRPTVAKPMHDVAFMREEAIDFTQETKAKKLAVRSSPLPTDVDLTLDETEADAELKTKSIQPAKSTLDITFAPEAAVHERDEVDDLFAAAIPTPRADIKTMKPSSPQKPVVTRSKPPPGAIDAQFLEVSDGEEDAIIQVEAAKKTNARSPGKTVAPSSSNTEAEQIKRATQLSLQEMEARKSKRVGVSFGAVSKAAAPIPSPVVAASVSTLELPQAPAMQMEMSDDIDWEDEAVSAQSTSSSAAAASLPAIIAPVDDGGLMAMDMDSDSEEERKKVVVVKKEVQPIEQSDAMTDASPTTSLPTTVPLAAATPSSTPVELIPYPVVDRSNSHLAPPSPVIASSKSSPRKPSSPAISRSPHFPLSPAAVAAETETDTDMNDSTELHEDDVAEMRRDQDALKRLLGEIKDIDAEIKKEAIEIGSSDEDDDDDVVVVEEKDDEIGEKTVESSPEISSAASPIVAASSSSVPATSIIAPTSSSSISDGIILPSGLTMKTSSAAAPKNKVHTAFLESQRQKRALEAEAEKRMQDQQGTTAFANALPDSAASSTLASAVDAQPSAGSSTGESMVYEAFPSHLSTREAISLAQSFDSSYLDSQEAQKKAADAIRGEAHVTEEMLEDSKALLKLFGMPYIESPGEAEAQCAALEMIGHVDGTITDDSDVFLFGAKNVYRHFFEEKKFCEKYSIEEIKSQLGFDRAKLVHWALLLGSDYTAGVRGIGIVNATEILSAFPGEDGLTRLVDWIYSLERDAEPSLPQYPDDCTEEQRAQLSQEYRTALFKYQHRNVKRTWAISRDTFPNREVIEGYWHPNVDESRDNFTWQQPDWNGIEKLCREKLQMSEESVSSMLQPVQRVMEQSRQTGLDRFFSPSDNFAVIASDRLNRAVKGLVSQNLSEEELKHQADMQAKKLAKSEKAKLAAKTRKRKKAGGVMESLLEDDFELSAEDEAMLDAIEAASPIKPKPSAAASSNSPLAPSSAAASSAASSSATASATVTPKKPTKPRSNKKQQKSPADKEATSNNATPTKATPTKATPTKSKRPL